MKQKSSSWKQKIDPAFDKFITFYLEALEKMCLPHNKGYIALNERRFETIELEGFPGLGSMYEHDRPLDALADLGVVLDEPLREEDMKEIKRELRKEKNMFKLILEGAELLREDSKNYYLNVFKPCVSKEAYDEFISTKDESDVKTFIKRIKGDALSFLFHSFTIPLENKKDEIRRSIEMRNLKWSTRMIKRTLFYTWDAVSLMVNGASLKELFKRAREGDDGSLFNLIKVDKTLFEHDWVRKRINKASYSGDHGFFESLGDAVKSDPLAHDRRKGELDKLFIILKYFWNYGLYRLSDNELHEFLIESEIANKIEIYDNVESFVKFLQRNRAYLPK